MKIKQLIQASCVVALASFVVVGCTEEVKLAEDNSGNANQEVSDDSTGGTTTVYADAYYASFDGVNDYALMLLGEQVEWSVADPSIAKVEEAEVNLSEETLNELVDQNWDSFQERIKERCEQAAEEAEEEGDDDGEGIALQQNETRQDPCTETLEVFKERFSERFRVQKIIPLKAGTTTLNATGRAGRGGSTFAKNLVITDFAAGEYDAGKERYSSSGEGNLKACESCHLAGEENAPPHSLGRVKDFSDEAILEWVTTGSYGGTEAAITHTWEFSSDEQERGIIPYLRSLQAKDVNSLAEQYIAEIEGEFEDGIGGSN